MTGLSGGQVQEEKEEVEVIEGPEVAEEKKKKKKNKKKKAKQGEEDAPEAEEEDADAAPAPAAEEPEEEENATTTSPSKKKKKKKAGGATEGYPDQVLGRARLESSKLPLKRMARMMMARLKELGPRRKRRRRRVAAEQRCSISQSRTTAPCGECATGHQYLSPGRAPPSTFQSASSIPIASSQQGNVSSTSDSMPSEQHRQRNESLSGSRPTTMRRSERLGKFIAR